MIARKLTLSLLFALLVAVPLAAQERPVGVIVINASGVDWQATGSFEKLTLSVLTPSGAVITRDFNGAHASFRTSDLAPRVAADGIYQWELRGTPRISADVRNKLAQARAANDDDAIGRIRSEAGLTQTFVQSGAFSIRSGSFVVDTPEPTNGKSGSVSASSVAGPSGEREGGSSNAPASIMRIPARVGTMDLVTAQNEEIQGSLCVGLDCVSGESFGFDTIRLKENNTRIKFQDTSTSAGFPTHDWQLTANDSASGGAEKFSIEDITAATVPFTITGSAPNNSIFVSSAGKVGIRTSAPGLDVHISSTDTPAIRQEQTSGGGFTAQTWDIGANEANWFVRDVTGGSRLPLRIRPGAPTSSIDIAASGNVGSGTASPTERFHVYNNADSQTVVMSENPATTSNAAAILRAKSDTAQVHLTAQSSTRAVTRFGQSIAGWNELVQITGNGLAIGTTTNVPLIIGTNNANRLQIDGAGNVTVSGNFSVTGTKSFAMPDPANAKHALYYAALEGPEAGTYFRGTAKTVDGEAVIELPGYFSRITERERMTVQLTPIGAPGQLYISEKSPERVVIKSADGAKDIEFDYFVQGVRKGYLDFQVERENDLPKN